VHRAVREKGHWKGTHLTGQKKREDYLNKGEKVLPPPTRKVESTEKHCHRREVLEDSFHDRRKKKNREVQVSKRSILRTPQELARSTIAIRKKNLKPVKGTEKSPEKEKYFVVKNCARRHHRGDGSGSEKRNQCLSVKTGQNT